MDSSSEQKRALITGITGQDGAYLARLLIDKGYEVFGTMRRSSTPNFWRLQDVEVLDKVKLFSADLSDNASLLHSVKESHPNEIYNLAAQSFVGSSFDQPINSAVINGIGVLKILEIVKDFDRNIRIYQASTSEMYGDSVSENHTQREDTPFKPNSPYAAAKLFAFNTSRIYREAYDMFVSNGILFNHESPLRGLEFVTRKISNGVARIKQGLDDGLTLGNLDSQRDWGYAPEYVDAMWRMLQHDEPDDFVVATNHTHSVREFVDSACAAAGIDPKKHIKTHQKHQRPYDVQYLKGDYTKAREKLGWTPTIDFSGLVLNMVDADVSRWKNYQEGILAPWDAINFSEDVEYINKRMDR